MNMDDTDELLFNASGQPMKVKGRLWCQVSYGVTGKSHKVDALVTSSMKDEILISWHDLEALRAVSLVLEVKTAPIDQVALQGKMDTLKEKYIDVLSDKLAELPMVGPPMKVHMKAGAIPKKIWSAKQPPLHFMEVAENLVSDSIESGVLRRVPTSESTDWITRGLFVVKPNGKSLRLVVDYSELNKYIDRPLHLFIAQWGKRPFQRQISNFDTCQNWVFCIWESKLR
jgi:hypothetical protein